MTTPNLDIGELTETQQSKYLTINNSLRKLDSLVVGVISRTTTAEPGSPSAGDVYILPSGKTGANWASMANNSVVYYSGSSWEESTAIEGMIFWVNDDNELVIFDGSSWTNPIKSSSDDVTYSKITSTGNYIRSVTAGLTASTTQTQGQGALTDDINEISTCANTNDTVTLPTAAAGMGITVINNGAQTLRIFPASGDDLGSGVDTATTLTAGSVVRYQAYDATNWVAV